MPDPQQELFLAVVYHCSGGHGDTASVICASTKLEEVLEAAQQAFNRLGYTMSSSDHGVHVRTIELNHIYSRDEDRRAWDSRNSTNVVYFRYRGKTQPFEAEWNPSAVERYGSRMGGRIA